MLEQLAYHAELDLIMNVKGDINIDEHHTIEDTGIALGFAFRLALGEKRSIYRYGFCLPMDDSVAQVSLDVGGRCHLGWQVKFDRYKILLNLSHPQPNGILIFLQKGVMNIIKSKPFLKLFLVLFKWLFIEILIFLVYLQLKVYSSK